MRSRETLLRLHRFRTEEKRRQAADIDGMIQDFMRKFDDLDAQALYNAARNVEGWILTICTVVMMVLAVIILGAAAKSWVSVMNGGPVPATAETT